MDVCVEVRGWSFGLWMKEGEMKGVGLWARVNAIDTLQATAITIWTKLGGRSREEVEAELVAVRKDLMNPGIHSYMPM